MFYYKSNGKFAAPVAGGDDVKRLDQEGVAVLAELAKDGDALARACLQRLVNSSLVPEGNY